MCGIAGVLSLKESESPTEGLLRRMVGTIRHRGPDQFGVYLADGVGLGNARLSIIDLGGGQQPIGNEDGSLWIVYNGEVFNYLELQQELQARGHRLATDTDTEVILHLFEEFGPACLGRLNGQFAIAIWNERDRQLFLARDRVGVRPLFYHLSTERLVFGSEIKAILAHPGVSATLDPVALDQVFTYWSPLSPRTCFRGICELPPGHYLLVHEGGEKPRPYWRPVFPGWTPDQDLLTRPVESYEEELRGLLEDATRIRLRADVPVGAYLSGGLDSSVIAAVARRFAGGRLDTFSIAFADPQFDESPFQRRMAEFLGTEHQVVFATHRQIGEVFPDVIWHAECPVMRTAPAPMYLLSRLVNARKYKVVLTGEGADEFLAGYDIFKEAMVRRFWARQPESAWRPRLLQRLYPDIAGLRGTGDAYLKAFFGAGLREVDRPGYSHAIRWRNNRRTCRFFSKELTAQLSSDTAGTDGPPVPPEFSGWGPLQRAQYLEISLFLSQYLLSSQGDRMGMAHAVEGRFPFLDFRVMEFCNRLPARLKLHGLREKYLLRRVAKPWLPADICARGKRPYRAPIHRCFFGTSAPEYVRELLSESALARTGWFHAPAVRQLVAQLDAGKTLRETDDMALVGILSTQLVQRQFVEDFRATLPLDAEDDVKVVDRRGRRLAAGQSA